MMLFSNLPGLTCMQCLLVGKNNVAYVSLFMWKMDDGDLTMECGLRIQRVLFLLYLIHGKSFFKCMP